MSIKLKNKLICALDNLDYQETLKILSDISDVIGGAKFGIEALCRYGLDGISKIGQLYPDLPFFLDFKFHDIPKTVELATKQLSKITNTFLITVHSSGGSEMIRAALCGAEEKFGIVAVTKLTSIASAESEIFECTENALKLGVDGIVTPALYAANLREKFKQYGNFTIVSPGIRLDRQAANDHQLTQTPAQAVNSTYLVIGRPIVESKNPKATIFEILKSINQFKN